MRRSKYCMRVSYLLIALISVMFISISHVDAKQELWRFEKIDPYKAPKTARNMYMLTVKNTVRGEVGASSIAEPGLQLIMQYFGVKKPADLVGKVFSVDDLETPWAKLDELAV